MGRHNHWWVSEVTTNRLLLGYQHQQCLIDFKLEVLRIMSVTNFVNGDDILKNCPGLPKLLQFSKRTSRTTRQHV